jgi:hypothetical protein
MPLSPQEYEELVKKLIDSLLRNNDVLKIENIDYGKGNKIEGASGHKHQIDIAYRDPQNQSLILIECKRWQSKIKIDHVLTFHCRLVDILNRQNVTTEGIMVTTVGYQKGAKKYGDKYGIKLGKVKDESEFGIFIRNLGFMGVVDKGVVTDHAFVKKTPPFKPNDH